MAMKKLKDIYRENIYGVMGTLLFHIALGSAFFISEVRLKGEVKEEPIIIDFMVQEEPEPCLLYTSRCV